jgi:hypothetical protein
MAEVVSRGCVHNRKSSRFGWIAMAAVFAAHSPQRMPLAGR